MSLQALLIQVIHEFVTNSAAPKGNPRRTDSIKDSRLSNG